MEPSPDNKLELLAARANVVRSHLSATLTALDRRRREIMSVPLRVTRHLTFAGVVVGVCLTGVVVVTVYRAATAARRRRYERWRMVSRVWNHPERAARDDGTILGRLARALLVSAGRAVVTRVLVEAAKNVGEAESRALTASPTSPVEPYSG